MMCYPINMTDSLRARLLFYRENPPNTYWYGEHVYAWQYPSDDFTDSLGVKYYIWRDTKTDDITKITFFRDNNVISEVDVKLFEKVIHAGNSK